MTTKQINFEMLRFKESSRHLWNTAMVPAEGRASVQTLLAFETIERELFRSIVLEPYGLASLADLYRSMPLFAISIRPKCFLDEIPIQNGVLEENGNTRWHTPVLVPANVFPVLAFFDFFDWDAYGQRDFVYIRAASEKSASLSLIEHTHSDFFVEI